MGQFVTRDRMSITKKANFDSAQTNTFAQPKLIGTACELGVLHKDVGMFFWINHHVCWWIRHVLLVK